MYTGIFKYCGSKYYTFAAFHNSEKYFLYESATSLFLIPADGARYTYLFSVDSDGRPDITRLLDIDGDGKPDGRFSLLDRRRLVIGEQRGPLTESLAQVLDLYTQPLVVRMVMVLVKILTIDPLTRR